MGRIGVMGSKNEATKKTEVTKKTNLVSYEKLSIPFSSLSPVLRFSIPYPSNPPYCPPTSYSLNLCIDQLTGGSAVAVCVIFTNFARTGSNRITVV